VDPSNPGVAELEAFLGAPLADLPMRTPNMHAEERDYASWTPADRYLDLLEGMWLAQALKERHFDSWISDLRNMHIEQVLFPLLLRFLLLVSIVPRLTFSLTLRCHFSVTRRCTKDYDQ
jgi:hypothetical protein